MPGTKQTTKKKKLLFINLHPANVAGLFFCLAPAEGAGLLFCPTAHEPHKSVYSGFYIIHAVIPPTPQNGAQGFTGAFPAICRVFSLLCGCASGYTAPPAPRWSVSQHRSTSTDTRYHCHTGRCTGQRSHRPCQPGGGLDASHARRRWLWHRSAARARLVNIAHSTRRSSPAGGAQRAARKP